MYKKMNPSNNLPGLFHYKAASYGDAIGLTILIGSLVAFAKKKLPLNDRRIYGKEEKRWQKITKDRL